MMTSLRRRVSPTAWLGLGIWLLLLVTNPGRNETVDVSMRVLVARQMWSSLSISIPSDGDRQGLGAWIQRADGRWVAPYGIGESILFAPFDAMGFALARGAPESIAEYVRWLPIGLILLPALGVLWWYVSLRVLLEWGLSRNASLVGATVMHLGTIMFYYAGQGQEEALVGLLLSCSLLFMLRARRSLHYRDAILAGVFAGACLITRPVSVFALSALPFVAARLWVRDSKRFGLIVAAAAAVVLVGVGGSVAYNVARFGTPFSVGYDRLGHFANLSLDQRSIGVFGSLLLGPGFGLFVLSPVLLFALLAQRTLWRVDRGYLVGLWVAGMSCLLFFASWHDSYTGGTAWGTRYQCHLLSLFVLPVALGLLEVWRAKKARSLTVALVVVTGLLQLVSVTATSHLEGYQSFCEGAPENEFRTGLRSGQLGRRLENIGRWVSGLPPAVATRPSIPCRESIEKMWQRYVPNFWGPVFAKRLGSWGALVLAVWASLVVATTAVLSWSVGLLRPARP